MSKFSKQDEIGREKFISICKREKWCKFNKKSPNEYDVWDVSYMSGGTRIIGEIKDRDISSQQYDELFLEFEKFNNLKLLRDKLIEKDITNEKIRIQYINFFNDGITIIWDITNIDNYVIREIKMQKSEFGDRTQINKKTILLPTNKMIYCDFGFNEDDNYYDEDQDEITRMINNW